jgi:hypothetical protein
MVEGLLHERTAELPKANRALELEIQEHEKTEAELPAANALIERAFSTTHLTIALMYEHFNFLQAYRALAAADSPPEDFFLDKHHFTIYPCAESGVIIWSIVAKGEVYTVRGKLFFYPDHPERRTTCWEWILYPIKGSSGERVSWPLPLKTS